VNPHSKWYHCLCCMPKESTRHENMSKNNGKIDASPAGHWDNGKFQSGPQPTEAFKKEFEGK